MSEETTQTTPPAPPESQQQVQQTAPAKKPTREELQSALDALNAEELAKQPKLLTDEQLRASGLKAHLSHKGPERVPGYCE